MLSVHFTTRKGINSMFKPEKTLPNNSNEFHNHSFWTSTKKTSYNNKKNQLNRFALPLSPLPEN